MSGLASCVVCIAAIETILQYNKIVGVNSIASTGQYLAFILGVSTFITACWQALKQETVYLPCSLKIPPADLIFRNEDGTFRGELYSTTTLQRSNSRLCRIQSRVPFAMLLVKLIFPL